MKKHWIEPVWHYLDIDLDLGLEDDAAATGSAS